MGHSITDNEILDDTFPITKGIPAKYRKCDMCGRKISNIFTRCINCQHNVNAYKRLSAGIRKGAK